LCKSSVQRFCKGVYEASEGKVSVQGVDSEVGADDNRLEIIADYEFLVSGGDFDKVVGTGTERDNVGSGFPKAELVCSRDVADEIVVLASSRWPPVVASFRQGYNCKLMGVCSGTIPLAGTGRR